MEAAEHDETEKKGGFIIGFSETNFDMVTFFGMVV